MAHACCKDTQIVAEVTNSCVTLYVYDINGLPLGMQYHDADNPIDEWEMFWYEKNLQGDIIGVYDQAGEKLIEYTYDAWGNFTESYLHSAVDYSPVSNNPFTYRGYYYDRDLGLYYLNSRYYDSNTGRFISPDDASYLGANGDINSYNLYAYCSNNPVMYQDPSGNSIIGAILIGALIGGAIGGISNIVGQAVSGNEINWAEVGISAASGALTGAITSACPGMGAVMTGVVHGAVGAGTYAATELVNGRTPTIAGTLTAGVVSGVLAGATKAISNKLTTTKLYRSVNPAEADSFLSTRKLSAGVGQMEGKFFATSKADAKMWGLKLGSNKMISIRVPNSALSHSSVTYFPRLDAIGPAYYFSDLAFLNSIFR